MKRLILSSLVLWMSSSAVALTPDFNAYFRAGTGTNNRGGAMECYSNKGAASGNEMRLGNECGIYGEFLFGAYLLKSEKEGGPFWRMSSNFAFSSKNSTDYETNNAANQSGSTNPGSWVVRELFTEGGNFDGMNFSVWAGKRFYRWGDLHMHDFFPIDMSGPGAGIGGMKSDLGLWSVAVIQNSESSEFPGSDTTVATDKGRAAKTSLHIRLEDIASPVGAWSVWLAGGQTPKATATTGGTEYKQTQGALLGIRNVVKIGPGQNDLGVAYGNGVMSNLTARGDLSQDCTTTTLAACTVQKSNRIRAWEGYVFDSGNWSSEIALIYDAFNSGADENSKVQWMSAGIRPMYWFTDNISLAFETGISNVTDEGDGLGSRNLVRATIAPQLSLGRGYASRPVIRAFYTHNSWNENNKVSFASTTAANDTSSDTVGVQTEIWF